MEPAPSPYKAQTTVEISYRSVGNINEAEKMRLDDAQLFRRNSREPLDRGQLASSKRSINSASSAPFSKPDVLYSGSVQNLPEVKKFGNVQDFRASVNAVNAEKYPKRSRLFPDSASRIIRQMLDVSLLKNYTFLLTCFSSFLTLAGFFIPFVFIKKFVLGTGVSDSEGTWILSVRYRRWLGLWHFMSFNFVTAKCIPQGNLICGGLFGLGLHVPLILRRGDYLQMTVTPVAAHCTVE